MKEIPKQGLVAFALYRGRNPVLNLYSGRNPAENIENGPRGAGSMRLAVAAALSAYDYPVRNLVHWAAAESLNSGSLQKVSFPYWGKDAQEERELLRGSGRWAAMDNGGHYRYLRDTIVAWGLLPAEERDLWGLVKEPSRSKLKELATKAAELLREWREFLARSLEAGHWWETQVRQPIITYLDVEKPPVDREGKAVPFECAERCVLDWTADINWDRDRFAVHPHPYVVRVRKPESN